MKELVMVDFGGKLFIYITLSLLLSSCDIFRSGPLLLDDNSTCRTYITDAGIVEVYAQGNLSRGKLQTVSNIQIMLNGNFDVTLDSLKYMFEGSDSVYSVNCYIENSETIKTGEGKFQMMSLKSDTILGGLYPFRSVSIPEIYEKSKTLYILPSNGIIGKGIPILIDTIKVNLQKRNVNTNKGLDYTKVYGDLKLRKCIKNKSQKGIRIDGVYCLSKENDGKQWRWKFYEDGSCVLQCIANENSNVICSNPGIYKVDDNIININLYSGGSYGGTLIGYIWRFARLKFNINDMKSITLMNCCNNDSACLEYTFKTCQDIDVPECVERLKKTKGIAE